MPPTIHVDNPGTSSTEFVASEAAPKIKFYTKRWTPSQTPPVAGALFIHGFLENVDRYDHVFPSFAAKGIDVLAFDQRGFGKTAQHGNEENSEQVWRREHGNTTRTLQYQDIAQMIRLQKNYYADKYGAQANIPLFVIGHSMGGGLSLAMFTRPPSETHFPKETLHDIAGVVSLAPWLRLTDQPPAIVPAAAGLLINVWSSARKKAPLKPEHVSRDPEVVKEYSANPYTNPDVTLKAIHGPLTSGMAILNKEYVHWPEHMPLLVIHGDADKVTDHKGSREIVEKIKAKDKKYIELKGFYHEMHNEPGEDKVVVINHITDWVLSQVSKSSQGGGVAAAGAAPSSGQSLAARM